VELGILVAQGLGHVETKSFFTQGNHPGQSQCLFLLPGYGLYLHYFSVGLVSFAQETILYQE
jgi:hypothetical protein